MSDNLTIKPTAIRDDAKREDTPYYSVILQIYRAFNNDGWTRLADHDRNLLALKTGKEWYELFRRELHDVVVNPASGVRDDAKEFRIARAAARRAAGLEAV